MREKRASAATTLELTNLPIELIIEIVNKLSLKDALEFLKSHKDWYIDDGLRAVIIRKHEEYLAEVKIIAGSKHTLVLSKATGQLWVCGSNY